MSDGVGRFLISLDFELYWGVHDAKSIEEYGSAIRGARRAVTALLELFGQFDVHATWASVGLLFFNNVEEVLDALPPHRPRYRKPLLDSYRLLDRLEAEPALGDMLFARDLILEIKNHAGQEIGTHTFCHYYCWEDGDDDAAFRADLTAAIDRAARLGIEIRSIVFPRNQVKPDYLPICLELGIRSFRDRPESRLFTVVEDGWQKRLNYVGRVADSFLPIDLPHMRPPSQADGEPVSLIGSRFLRAGAVRSSVLKALHLNRIKGEMTRAAQEGGLYHLWWHPHNFGLYTEQKIAFLRDILLHYQSLHASHGMISATMDETAKAYLAAGLIRSGVQRPPTILESCGSA